MGIPIFHKKSKNTEPLTHGMTESKKFCCGIKHSSPRLFSRVSGVENFIEIKLPPCCESYFCSVVLLILWLFVVVSLLYTRSAITTQLHDQCSKITVLEAEIQKLIHEVGGLKSQLSSPYPVMEHPDVTSIGAQLYAPVRKLILPLQRKKRSSSEDVPGIIKSSASSRRTMAKITTRRGNRTHCMVKLRKKQKRLEQCCKLCRLNVTKFGGRHDQPAFRLLSAFAGIRAIHFKGAHPEALVEAGRVGPWNVDARAVTDNEVLSFQLKDDGESVEIKEPGLYFIYAQVYYLTTQMFNSFSIVLLQKDSETPIPIALCSLTINSISSTSEVSCYTAIIRTLQFGDRVYLQQREKHRRLIMRGGHTFLGFAKLTA